MCPISIMSEGKQVEIVQLLGGRAFTARLEERGLFPGSSVVIIQNSGGALLVSIGSSRFAIGRGMARKIFVREKDTDQQRAPQ